METSNNKKWKVIVSNKKKFWIEAPVNKSNERLDFRNRKSSDETEKEQMFDFVGEIEIFISLANPIQIFNTIKKMFLLL